MTKKEIRAAKKRLMEIRGRKSEIQARLAEMKATLTAEKRQMTEAENGEFSTLSDELAEITRESENIRIDILESQATPEQHENEVNNRAAFAQLVCAVSRRSAVPEEMRGMIDKGDIVIPISRALTDTTSVAPVVPITVEELMKPLNNGIIFDKVGLKIQTGLKGQFNFPSVTGVEATFEDENVEVSDQAISMTKLSGNPKRIAISVPVSNTAIDESNINLQALVIELFNDAMSNILNKWMFSKTKLASASQPGCFVAALAAPAVSVAKASAIGWADIVNLETAIMKKHLPITGASAFVCSSPMLAVLRTTPKPNTLGGYIAEPVPGAKGEFSIDGYPVFVTEDFDDNSLGLGVFEYDLLGQFGQVRLTIDPYTDAKKNITRFVFNTRWDNVVLRPEAFAALTHLTA
jgi:HK97 family phage major capsid protein